MPSGPAPVDVVDSGFGLTTPRGYSGAKEVGSWCFVSAWSTVLNRGEIGDFGEA